jgi:LysM repeat protein
LPDAQFGATVASPLRRAPRALAMVLLAFVIALAGSVALQPQPVAAASGSKAVTKTAQSLTGTRYAWGATGMNRFDCSGFVFRVYQMNGLLDKIGGKRRTAAGYFKWFRSRGLTTKQPAVGDLVVWGRNSSHIGIYVGTDGQGKALAISALVTGVARHRVKGINLPLKAYLRVNLGAPAKDSEQTVASQAASKKATSSSKDKSSSKATSSTAKSSSKAAPSRNTTYKVKKGDTMTRIARKHGVTLKKLLRANPQVVNKHLIRVRQVVFIP